MSEVRDAAAFLLATVLFGTAFPAIEAGLRHVPPVTLAAARYALAAPCLFAFVALADRDWRLTGPADRRAALVGGVLMVAGNGVAFVGQQSTTGGVAAILYGVVPVLTVALSRAWLESSFSRRELAGVLVGFVGVVLVATPTRGPLLANGGGELLVCVAAASVATGTVGVRALDHDLPPTALAAWSMLVGAVVLAAAALLLGEHRLGVAVTPASAFVVAYLAVAVGAVGFVAYFALVERRGALDANLVTYSTPLVSLAVGAVALDEPLYPTAVLGFGVVVAGFALLARDELAAALPRPSGSF